MGNNEVRAKLDELHRRMTLWLAEPDAPSTKDLVNAVTLIEEDEQSQPAPDAGEGEAMTDELRLIAESDDGTKEGGE